MHHVWYEVSTISQAERQGSHPYSTESLTHLGIDRYANDPSPDVSIDDRLSLGRRSAYALMGSGFHGMNGISPAISIHIYRTYVLPRVLYGQEGTILKSKHITKLERFHRKTLRQLQTLPDRTATREVYLLGGILPLEAYLDAQIATLIYMVGHDMDSSLAHTALYQMSNKESKSSSWFVYSYIRLKRYDLDPLDILHNYIRKGDIRMTIRSYWFNIITNEAEEESSLSYIVP